MKYVRSVLVFVFVYLLYNNQECFPPASVQSWTDYVGVWHPHWCKKAKLTGNLVIVHPCQWIFCRWTRAQVLHITFSTLQIHAGTPAQISPLNERSTWPRTKLHFLQTCSCSRSGTKLLLHGFSLYTFLITHNTLIPQALRKQCSIDCNCLHNTNYCSYSKQWFQKMFFFLGFPSTTT